jgi:hypothetical protein
MAVSPSGDGWSNGARLPGGVRRRNGTGELFAETRMKLKHAAAVVVALLVIASLAAWMFASEDPPPDGEPAVIEAG